MRNRILLTLFLLGSCACIRAQAQTVTISIQPCYGDSPINLADSAFSAPDTSRLHIDVLRFYLSHVQLLDGGEVVVEEPDSYHLVDAAEASSLRFSIGNKEGRAFDALRFNLGIDSATNASGVMGGALDPTQGMYWAWQSGYINFKLEGRSPQCQTRNQEFVFHLGGYQGAFYAMQPLSFPVGDKEHIVVQVDVAQLLRQVDLRRHSQIMSPGAEAVALSKVAGRCFSIRER